jgi:hypothetical protein
VIDLESVFGKISGVFMQENQTPDAGSVQILTGFAPPRGLSDPSAVFSVLFSDFFLRLPSALP